MQRLAILRLVSQPWANASVETVLTKMVVPEWARLLRVKTNNAVWPEYTDMLFENFGYSGHFYLTPENCLPPQLYIDNDGNIDWHSCDGNDTRNGLQACPDYHKD